MLGLFLFGGEVLRGFGFTMVVGILVGTYSTIYIASPLVVWWDDFAAAPASRRGAERKPRSETCVPGHRAGADWREPCWPARPGLPVCIQIETAREDTERPRCDDGRCQPEAGGVKMAMP